MIVSIKLTLSLLLFLFFHLRLFTLLILRFVLCSWKPVQCEGGTSAQIS